MRPVRWIMWAVACAVLAATGASAQQASGIAGAVRDESGGVLPGVTVEASSPALIEKVRSVVSDGEGRYNIVDLRPGTYVVTFTLGGFNTLRREGIELTAGFTATINADLKVGALEETITVSGATPLVDTQNVRQQTVVSERLLDALPSSGKSLVGYAKLIPGLKGGSDVGGAAGLWATGNVIADTVHGKGGAKFSYDGMQTNNYGGSGATSYLMNPATVQETAVETGGVSAESNSAGIAMNLVPKEGGNNITLMASGLYSGESLHGDNLNDELRRRGVTNTTKVLNVYDGNGAIGGPIRRNRVWFFAATRFAGNKNRVNDVYFNSTRGTRFYTPDFSQPSYRKEWLKSQAGRVTWQATERNKFNVFADVQNYMVRGRGDFTAPEAHTVWSFWPAGLYQATWNMPKTNRLLFEAGWSLTRNDFPGSHTQSTDVFGFTVPTTDVTILEASTGFRYNARATYSPTHIQYRVVERFSTSYVTGSHAFKVGLQWQQGYYDVETFVNSDGLNPSCADCPVQYTFLNGAPLRITQWAAPYLQKNRIKADLGVFAQDQWSMRRMTLNYGLRLDYFNSYVPPQNVPASAFVAERNFAPVSRVPEWTDLNPRVGLSYDLFGTGRTALKSSIGRYVGVMGINVAQNNNPTLTAVNNTNRVWSDANGNYVPDCDLRNFGANGECGPIDNVNFGRNNPNATRYADDMIRGFGKRDFFWEFAAEIQQQLRQGMSMKGGYYRNWSSHFPPLGDTGWNTGVTDNLAVGPQDFDSYCVTAPLDPRLPGGGGYPICGMYDVSPSKFGLQDNLVVRPSNFGERSRVSDFFTLALDARFGKGNLGANLDTGRTVENNCFVIDAPGVSTYSPALFTATFYGANNATTIDGKPLCRSVSPFKGNTQVKVFGSYSLPLGMIVSGTLQNLSGIAIEAHAPIANDVIATSLGRNLAACGTRTVCTATATVPLIAPFSMFEPRRTQLDLRLSKTFGLGDRLRLRANLDVYNVLNGNGVIRINNTYGSRWLTPLSTAIGSGFLEARLVQLGGQLTF
ncbi:MAG: carboxypeptidase regulatory-like domain-containing protein [Vicinamibacterales bacterium]